MNLTLFSGAWEKVIHEKNLPPVSTIRAANLPPVFNGAGGKLPPVSTTPVANNGDNIRLQTPLSEFEGKNFYIYANSTTQRCPNKTIKIFLLEDFFHLHLGAP
jgi:hypothetical protein